jgi:Flp pilus assembly protein TadD
MARLPRPDPSPRASVPIAWTRPVAAAVVALSAVAGAWWWWDRVRAGGGREGGLDVLLVTVDTLRADALSVYGQPRPTTPLLDRLARAGVRFDAAHAHNVTTLASHANILSGRLPFEHGVRDNAGFRFPAGTDTLATILKARGYRTGAFVSAFPLDARFGLARGFDVYDDRRPGAANALLVASRPGAETVARARAWLDTPAAGPTFCWVHVYEPHFPYTPSSASAARFPGAPYLGEVADADALLAPLLEPLLSAGRGGRTLVVLTSDHGESLGEHGEATHGIFAYEATLRVPLVLFQPRILRPRTVGAPARHVDILPTVLDALALPAATGLPGRSLLPAATGTLEATPVATYFEALSGSLNRGWAPLFGVVRDGVKLVDLPVPEVYDLRRDPGETRDLARADGKRLAALRAVLAPLRSADAGAGARDVDPATREGLRALGYLAGSAPSRRAYTEADDPKRLIAQDALLQDVVGRSLAGDVAGARALARDLVARHPGLTVARFHLAQLEREAGDLDAAAGTLRALLAAQPEDRTAAALLGATLTQAGHPAEAARVLEPYARAAEPDLEILTTYALALAREGRTADASAAADRAVAIRPDDASARLAAGTVRLTAGDREGARAAFAAAITADPQAARAQGALALMEAEDGRLQEAARLWAAAGAVDPREWRGVLAAASLLASRKREADARACLELFVAQAPAPAYDRERAQARSWLASGPPAR